jgi:hypothetical protein
MRQVLSHVVWVIHSRWTVCKKNVFFLTKGVRLQHLQNVHHGKNVAGRFVKNILLQQSYAHEQYREYKKY